MIIAPTPELIAKIILAGFNKHYSLFRRVPHSPDFEAEMASKSWYSAAKKDVSPEEFATC